MLRLTKESESLNSSPIQSKQTGGPRVREQHGMHHGWNWESVQGSHFRDGTVGAHGTEVTEPKLNSN